MSERPLPTVAATYERITGTNPELLGQREAVDTYAVPCVNAMSHKHGDSRPSLQLHIVKDVFICRTCVASGNLAAQGRSLALVLFSGICKTQAEALAWLLPEGRDEAPMGSAGPRVVDQYDYTDEDGKLLYQVQRIDLGGGKKTFKQRRPDGKSGWIWNLQDVRRVPYDLPGLRAAIDRGDTIFVPEGEKCVKAIKSIDLFATTNAGGAGWKWTPEFIACFEGATLVVFLGDNDDPGRAWVRVNGERLAEAGIPVRRVDSLPGATAKDDVADYIEAGHTQQQFLDDVGKLAKAVGPELDDGSLHVWTVSEIGSVLRSEPPIRPGVPFGFRFLDEKLYGMQPGQFTTLAARTNVGKTAAVERIVCSAALNGRKVSACVLESGARGFYTRVLARAFDMQVKDFRKNWHDPEIINQYDVRQYERQFENTLKIVGATRKLNLERIEEHISIYRPELFVIDHARHIEGWMTGGGKRSDLAPSEILYALDEMMPRYGCHLLLLSQCTRDAHASRPQLNELRDAGAIEEVSDNVIMLHRPYMYSVEPGIVDDVMEWLVWKSRETGRFIAHTIWEGPTMDILEPSEMVDVTRASRCCATLPDDVDRGAQARRKY